MIGLKTTINNPDIKSFTNFRLIDTSIAFKDARKKIEYMIPELTRYLSGDRTKSKVYGSIKKFYPEEIMYMDSEILSDNENIKNNDYIIEDSCNIYPDLRVIVVKENIYLPAISGYDIVSCTRGNTHINTIFVQDGNLDAKTIFSICLKIFDLIIISSLYPMGIPITNGNLIQLELNTFDNNNAVHKFITDYIFELIYPFHKNFNMEDKDMDDILKTIQSSNYQILDDDQISKLNELVKDEIKGLNNDYDLVEFALDLS